MSRDMALALGMLVLSAILYYETLSFPPGSAFRASPATFPQFLIGILAALSLLLMVRTATSERPRLSLNVAAVSRIARDYWLVIAMFGLFAVYILAMKAFSFVPATLAYLVAAQLLIARRLDLRSIALTVGIAGVATFSVYYTFTHGLRIWLP